MGQLDPRALAFARAITAHRDKGTQPDGITLDPGSGYLEDDPRIVPVFVEFDHARFDERVEFERGLTVRTRFVPKSHMEALEPGETTVIATALATSSYIVGLREDGFPDGLAAVEFAEAGLVAGNDHSLTATLQPSLDIHAVESVDPRPRDGSRSDPFGSLFLPGGFVPSEPVEAQGAFPAVVFVDEDFDQVGARGFEVRAPDVPTRFGPGRAYDDHGSNVVGAVSGFCERLCGRPLDKDRVLCIDVRQRPYGQSMWLAEAWAEAADWLAKRHGGSGVLVCALAVEHASGDSLFERAVGRLLGGGIAAISSAGNVPTSTRQVQLDLASKLRAYWKGMAVGMLQREGDGHLRDQVLLRLSVVADRVSPAPQWHLVIRDEQGCEGRVRLLFRPEHASGIALSQVPGMSEDIAVEQSWTGTNECTVALWIRTSSKARRWELWFDPGRGYNDEFPGKEPPRLRGTIRVDTPGSGRSIRIERTWTGTTSGPAAPSSVHGVLCVSGMYVEAYTERIVSEGFASVSDVVGRPRRAVAGPASSTRFENGAVIAGSSLAAGVVAATVVVAAARHGLSPRHAAAHVENTAQYLPGTHGVPTLCPAATLLAGPAPMSSPCDPFGAVLGRDATGVWRVRCDTLVETAVSSQSLRRRRHVRVHRLAAGERFDLRIKGSARLGHRVMSLRSSILGRVHQTDDAGGCGLSIPPLSVALTDRPASGESVLPDDGEPIPTPDDDAGSNGGEVVNDKTTETESGVGGGGAQIDGGLWGIWINGVSGRPDLIVGIVDEGNGKTTEWFYRDDNSIQNVPIGYANASEVAYKQLLKSSGNSYAPLADQTAVENAILDTENGDYGDFADNHVKTAKVEYV